MKIIFHCRCPASIPKITFSTKLENFLFSFLIRHFQSDDLHGMQLSGTERKLYFGKLLESHTACNFNSRKVTFCQHWEVSHIDSVPDKGQTFQGSLRCKALTGKYWASSAEYFNSKLGQTPGKSLADFKHTNFVFFRWYFCFTFSIRKIQFRKVSQAQSCRP